MRGHNQKEGTLVIFYVIPLCISKGKRKKKKEKGKKKKEKETRDSETRMFSRFALKTISHSVPGLHENISNIKS